MKVWSLSIFKRRLQSLGYAVLPIADTGANAIALATARSPDLILMDIHLADGSDGIAAACEIHSALGLPIVFLTAYADTTTLDRAAAAAPFGYIVKPFEERSLRATIQMALSRRQAEVKVQKMERWLATTLHSMADAVISIDAGGRLNYFNPQAALLTGWTPSEAVGLDYREILRFTRGDGAPPTSSHPMAEAIQTGVVINPASGASLLTRKGASIPVAYSAAPTRDEAGAVNGAVMILRDLAQQARDEQERREVEQRMREGQHLETLGALAGGIAHDFNNLLCIVTMNASLVGLSLPETAPEQQNLNDIQAAANRASDLCQQMLLYAGQGSLQAAPFDLNPVVKDTVALQLIAISKKADVRFSLAPNLPRVLGDMGQVRQVLTNLILNASEAFGEAPGRITIATASVIASRSLLKSAIVGKDMPEGPCLLLEVRDTGPGMDEETRARIFDPFFTTKFTGRGLGLAVVMGIIRRHCGALFLDSTPGAGACFRVFLPVAKDTPSPRQEPPAPGVGASRWKTHGSVLVADDESSIRRLAASMLRQFGFTVVQAADGQEALDILAQSASEIRLLITDLTMPRLTGLELARECARLYPALPVVVMSGFAAAGTIESFAGLPIKAFLQKPFSLDKLEKLARGILE